MHKGKLAPKLVRNLALLLFDQYRNQCGTLLFDFDVFIGPEKVQNIVVFDFDQQSRNLFLILTGKRGNLVLGFSGLEKCPTLGHWILISSEKSRTVFFLNRSGESECFGHEGLNGAHRGGRFGAQSRFERCVCVFKRVRVRVCVCSKVCLCVL